MSKSKQSSGVRKASEKLRKKLKEDEKVSLKSYTLSDAQDQPKRDPSPLKEDIHSVKPHRKGFRISTIALKKLQRVYVDRYSENPNITHSTLICEAIDLLFAKQNRKKTEKNSLSEQADFFS